MMERVLWVDDDADALLLVRRALNGRAELTTCTDGPEALKTVRQAPEFAVIASDMVMPGMSGAQLLAAVRDITPRSIRLMVTGLEDQRTAARAVNEGRVFGFLTKSAAVEELVRCVDSAIDEYHAQAATAEILQDTIVGAVASLMDALALAQPLAAARGASIRKLTARLTKEMGIRSWEIDLAAMVSQLGCLAMPTDLPGRVLQRQATPPEVKFYFSHPQFGASLLGRIPRLERVAEIVLHQHEQYPVHGFPENGVANEEVPLGSRIIKIAGDFVDLRLVTVSPAMALVRLQSRNGYDPLVLAALASVVEKEELERVAAA